MKSGRDVDQREAEEYLKMLAQAIDLKGDAFLGQFVEWVVAHKITQTAKIMMTRKADLAPSALLVDILEKE